MLTVISSAGLAGVPLSSVITTLINGTSPQLRTLPLKAILVVPKGTVAGQVLVTSTQGVVGMVVVQLFGWLVVRTPQTLVPDATTVSVSGPQNVGETGWAPSYGLVSPIAKLPIVIVMVPLEAVSVTVTPVSGTLPQL